MELFEGFVRGGEEGGAGRNLLGKKAEINVAVGTQRVFGAVEFHPMFIPGRGEGYGAEFKADVVEVGIERLNATVDQGFVARGLAVEGFGEPTAQGNDGDINVLDEFGGVGGEEGLFGELTGEFLVRVSREIKRGFGGFESATKEDVSDAVAGVGEELHGGEHEGAHGFETAGERGDDAGVGLAGVSPEFVRDGGGEGGVVAGGGEFVERNAPGAGAPVDDFDAVGGGIEIETRIGVGFLAEEGSAELPPNFVWAEKVFGEFLLAGEGGDDDDPVGDDGRIFLGESPDRLGEDGGREAGAGDEDGAGVGARR